MIKLSKTFIRKTSSRLHICTDYVTNGHWAIARLLLADPVLATASVETAVRHAEALYGNAKIDVGTLPDENIKVLLESLNPSKRRQLTYRSTPWVHLHGDTETRLFLSSGGHQCWIDRLYADTFGLGDCNLTGEMPRKPGEVTLGPLCNDDGASGFPTIIVMPRNEANTAAPSVARGVAVAA